MNAFDFRPRAIIEKLNLLRPIYRSSTNYGHFGRPGLPWEAVEKAGHFTPVPGGVGLLTVAMLMKNTLKAANQRRR